MGLDIASIHGRDAVKLPRFSIAWIMTIVVVAAIDFAAIRALDGTNTIIGGLMAIGSMPMAGILVLGILSLVRAIMGRGEIRPFLIGFEVVGWTVLLLYTGSPILFPESVAGAIDSAALSLMRLIGLDTVGGLDPSWQLFGLFLFVLILLLPQLAFALIGSWLNQRFRIRIIIERRRATGHETMSFSGSPRQVSMQEANSDPAA
jgi:hypothetical protein